MQKICRRQPELQYDIIHTTDSHTFVSEKYLKMAKGRSETSRGRVFRKTRGKLLQRHNKLQPRPSKEITNILEQEI